MPNTYFQFKQFTIHQDRCAMKVTTDGCLFGAWVAEKIKSKKSKTFTCLDIGAGTGLLSLMVAQKNPSCIIHAVEIDTAAAGQAEENCQTSPWKNNITVVAGDIKEMPPPVTADYSIIFSNPPFYENDLSSPDAAKNNAHHDSGLLLNELVTIISTVMAPAGTFFLMLPFKRLADFEASLQQYNLKLTAVTLVRPTTKHNYTRFFAAGEFADTKKPGRINSELTIKDTENNYSTEFIDLLKDYYLFL